MTARDRSVDLLVVGGGINGAAIARDAAGRGLSVYLAERGDYASATSSASSKMIHGGLRYLEHFELGLVRQSLRERAVLMSIAPHLVWPERFMLPIRRGGGRPAWLVRLGLRVYDVLAGRRRIAWSSKLPRADALALGHLRAGELSAVLCYWDCHTDDARLVIDTLLDARKRGADIGNYREVRRIELAGDGWLAHVSDSGAEREVRARYVVNAAGPWVQAMHDRIVPDGAGQALRLVRGSHIVVRQPANPLSGSWTLPLEDGRVVFVFPWQHDHLLIGTTEVEHEGSLDEMRCTAGERDYLLACYNEFFEPPLREEDVTWSFAGVRALVDDGTSNLSKLSRDYVLESSSQGSGGLVTVYGGKLTTHRALAEQVMDELAGLGADVGESWTATSPINGGDLDRNELASLRTRCPTEVDAATWHRWVDTYGSSAQELHRRATSTAGGLEEVVPGVPAAELDYGIEVEDVRTPEDFLARRTKLLLALDEEEQDNIAAWIRGATGGVERAGSQ